MDQELADDSAILIFLKWMKRDGEENETTYNQESKVLLVQTIAVHFEVGGWN